MRAFLCVACSGMTLALGVAASFVQSVNHELGAQLDDTQRRLELTRMWIKSAEATILAGESLELRSPAALRDEGDDVVSEREFSTLAAEVFQ